MWTVWFLTAYGVALLLAAGTGGVAYLWALGRSRVDAPACAAPLTPAQAREVVPDEGAILQARARSPGVTVEMINDRRTVLAHNLVRMPVEVGQVIVLLRTADDRPELLVTSGSGTHRPSSGTMGPTRVVWRWVVTADNVADPGRRRSDDELSLEELARRQGVVPVQSLHDMARPDLFDSDEDMEALIAYVYAARRADLA